MPIQFNLLCMTVDLEESSNRSKKLKRTLGQLSCEKPLGSGSHYMKLYNTIQNDNS